MCAQLWEHKSVYECVHNLESKEGKGWSRILTADCKQRVCPDLFFKWACFLLLWHYVHKIFSRKFFPWVSLIYYQATITSCRNTKPSYGTERMKEDYHSRINYITRGLPRDDNVTISCACSDLIEQNDGSCMRSVLPVTEVCRIEKHAKPGRNF